MEAPNIVLFLTCINNTLKKSCKDMHRLIVILLVKSVSCIITSFFLFAYETERNVSHTEVTLSPSPSDVHSSTNPPTVGLLKVKLMCEAGADPGLFLGGGAPLRNDVTDGEVKKSLKANTYKRRRKLHLRRGGGVTHPCTLPLDPPPRSHVRNYIFCECLLLEDVF